MQESAVFRVFAIPELFVLILSYLPPPPELYILDGAEVDDHRSKVVIERSRHLGSLLRAARVCKHWHATVLESKGGRQALFLDHSAIPTDPARLTSHGFRPSDDSSSKKSPYLGDHEGRNWIVPEGAPWLALNRAITALQRSGTTGALRATATPHTTLQGDFQPDPSTLPSLRSAANRDDQDGLDDMRQTVYGSVRVAQKQMYPGRPILNPLLQRHFPEASFRFSPVHGSDSARVYQAYLVVEREDLDRWNSAGLVNDIESSGSERLARVIDTKPLVPSWCHMQLASPPVVEVVAVEWERGPEPLPDADETPEDSRQMMMRDLPAHPRARHFYNRTNIRQEDGLTMGMLLAAVGKMFGSDEYLKAIKVCTH